MNGRETFPADFVWGAATSAYQIEGATEEDGRGESIWDRFASTPKKIADRSDGRIACDHYHLWPKDIQLLEWLGVGAYRFSIAWPRVLPQGRGTINEKGLAFYDALVDGLLEAGIEPFPTLYHWDLPQALEDEGGWGNRETTEAFAEYAEVVTRRLGDRVRHWVTHNEPWCIATLGHEHGHHAPGHKNVGLALKVAHHLLLSHGMALEPIRRNVRDAQVGIVHILSPAEPASENDTDRNAARQFDGLFNRWFLDPLFRGRYPKDAIQDRKEWGHLDSIELPFVHGGDLELISQPLDFLGVNYYSRTVVKAGRDGRPEGVRVVPKEELTDMGWEVYPDGLRTGLKRIHTDYSPPRIFVTENGAAYSAGPDADGRVHDPRRVEYFRGHLAAILQAKNEGVPVDGYFAWSLLDNFEWAMGYEKRFGLFWVDYANQKRLPKDSAHDFKRIVQSGRPHPPAEESHSAQEETT